MKFKIGFTAEKEVEKEHVCPECGKIEPPEARFCTKCGHKF